jgi:hypothetical protein
MRPLLLKLGTTHKTHIDRHAPMAVGMAGWRRGVVLYYRPTAFMINPSATHRHASSSAAASPCIASTLYDPTRKGPPTDDMLVFMDKLRSSGGSSGTVRTCMDDFPRACPLFLTFALSPLLPPFRAQVELTRSDRDDRVLELTINHPKSR